MDVLFLKLLNMSITAGWLILAVVALRLALKKAPKWISCALWALVGLRLVLPFSFESVWSLIPSAETVRPDVIYSETPGVTSGIPALNSAVNPVLSGSFAPAAGAAVGPLHAWTAIAAYVWLAGVAALLLYAAVSYLRLRKRVGASLHVRDNIWICDEIRTPFLLGILKPRIYLPSGMEDGAAAPVIAHETAHLQRRDHLWKPLGFALLAVYWFNPLCWLAYVLLSRDIELACDEKVVRAMAKPDRISYSEALLSCSVPRHMVMACPLAFGEVGVKERIKTVLNYKKPAFWIIVAAAVACVVVAVCFLTNPAAKPSDRSLKNEAWPLAQSCAAVNHVAIDKGNVEIVRAGDGTAIDVIYPLKGMEGCVRVRFDMNGDTVDSARIDLEKPTLSLNDVLTLSGKGEALTWSDFDKYSYIETGSGLYIRVYEIDEQFSLWIGGGPTDEPPFYLRLVSEADQDEYIDIRTDDVEAFVAAHGSSVSSVGGANGPTLIIDSANTYMYSVTVYMNPISSYMPVGTTGYLYKIDANGSLTIVNEETGDIFASVSNPGLDWSPLTTDEWNALFVIGDVPDISGIHEPRVMRLSDKYSLFDMDGSLWLGEYNGDGSGMWSVYELALYQPEQPPAAADSGVQETADPLDAAVSAAILEQNRNAYHEGDFACESHVTLATVSATPMVGQSTHEVIVYVMTLYQEYDLTAAGIHVVTGSHVPAALTFEADADGTHTLKDYWTPRDGSYYAPDIREKFPADIAEDALDTQKYILAQMQSCYAQAVEYGQVDTDAVVEPLLETITSSPTSSSNPADYIDAHPIEYRELTYYGDCTLRYVFGEFLKGGQTDLRGQIMMFVCQTILPALGEKEEPLENVVLTGQDWFDGFRSYADVLKRNNSPEDLKKNYPATWLLLKMIG